MATIEISGPMGVYDDDGPITDAQRLRALHGLAEKGANLADYLDGELAHLGIAGGDLKLKYDVRRNRLLVVSTYQSPQLLSAKRLSALVAYTRGQWSDGAGESAFHELFDKGIDGIDLTPFRTERQVRAAQVDRGGRKLKPTPGLLVAAEKGDLKKVKRLLEQGADIDTRGKGGETALQIAILHDQAPVAALLVNLGADVNLADKHGGTALATAAMGSHTRLARLLIGAGAIPNRSDKEGITPLMWAANRGNAALVKLLLVSGADPCAKDRRRTTPLMYVLPGATKVIDLLIAHGTDPKARNSQKQTAMEHALEQADLSAQFGEKREANQWRKQAEYLKRLVR